MKIGVHKREATKNLVDEPLKCLHSVAKTKWHLVGTKGGCYWRHMGICWLHGNLMSCSDLFSKHSLQLSALCRCADRSDRGCSRVHYSISHLSEEARMICTLDGSHCKNNSRKSQLSLIFPFSPSRSCIFCSHRDSLPSPSSSSMISGRSF